MKNLSFIDCSDKWKRIPGSGRAEDVCWDRQGHRRAVCTTTTPLECALNSKVHTAAQTVHTTKYTAPQCTQVRTPEGCLHNYTTHFIDTVHSVNTQFTASTQDSTEIQLCCFSLFRIPVLSKLHMYDIIIQFQSTDITYVRILENVFTEFSHGSHV